MYIRQQILDTTTGRAVCAIVANDNTVTPQTLAKWAAALAALVDATAGTKGQHTAHQVEDLYDALHALGKLAGAKPGGGGNHGKKDKGRCPVCGRQYPINKHGVLANHGKQYRINGVQSTRARHCSGSGKRPVILDNKATGETV